MRIATCTLEIADRALSQLANLMFLRGADGRERFYPFGIGGQGRVVASLAAGTRIRQRIKCGCALGLAILGGIVAVSAERYGIAGGIFAVLMPTTLATIGTFAWIA